MTKTYYAKGDGWISGTHYLAGDAVQMTPEAATYYVLEGRLSEDPPKPAKKAKD